MIETMSDARRDLRKKEVIASDGLLARLTGGYAKEKLSFIDEFGPPALEVSAGKIHRHYLEPFAGTGLNVDKVTKEEFDGAALRALRLTSLRNPHLRFTNAIFVNKDPRHYHALNDRISLMLERGESRVADAAIARYNADANFILGRIMRSIPRLGYLFAFVDIEGIEQWPWSSVEQLMGYQHTSVDLYLLFPLEMAIRRLIAYSEGATSRCTRVLTNYFGNEEWRPLVRQRVTDAQSKQLWRDLQDLYVAGLHRFWEHVRVVREVREGGRGLYRMLYCTNHDVAQKLGGWATEKEERREQLVLGPGF